MTDKRKLIIILLLALGLLTILAAFLISGASLLSQFYNGKIVTCTAYVSAPLIGSNLQLSTASCESSSGCFANPLMSITSVTGQIGIWHQGRLYDSVDVTALRVAPASQYTFSTCLPDDAQTVTVGVISTNGGTLNAQSLRID